MPEIYSFCHRFQICIYLKICAIIKVISVHLDVLCHAFDPIKVITDKEKSEKHDLLNEEGQQKSFFSRFNYHFLPPLFLISLIYVDTLYVLYTENLQFQYHAELFTSKILPEDFWSYGGTLLYIGITMQLTIYLNLFTRSKKVLPATHRKTGNHCSTVLTVQVDPFRDSVKLLGTNADKDEVNQEETFMSEALLRDLLHIRAKAYRLMTALYNSSVLQFGAFHLWQLLRHWTLSSPSSSSSSNFFLRNLIYLLLLPLLLLYTAYANVLLICYFILTALYILRRQNFYLHQLQELVGKLVTEVRNLLKKQTVLQKEDLELRCRLLWLRFNRLNGGNHLLRLFTEISAHNRFWSPLLTLVYAFHILLICYMAFTHYFVASQLEWYYRTFFLFFCVILSSTLLAVTAACSAIVHNNGRIFKLNNSFCLIYTTLGTSTFSLLDRIKVFW